MNKVLIAVTFHNQTRHTLHKTLRSTQFRNHLPNNWRCDTVVFAYDSIYDRMQSFHVELTEEETLGGKRNHAVKYARANNYQLIAFLDDDDLFGPSWIPGVCAQAETDFREMKGSDRIYHPQWNILFDSRRYEAREHFAQNDPRFDSRDMMFYNPWSALCAFNPLSAKWTYRKHKKSDPTYSFEDWSFNLDTWCGGQEHVAIPDTFHFLRMRPNSLGKSTMLNTLQHSKFFRSPELIQSHPSTADLAGDNDYINHEKLAEEMKVLHDVEPQIYYWRMPKVPQLYSARAGKTADAVCEIIKQMPFARDVFWMHDHKRIGGAEKALAYSAEFLSGFKDKANQTPHQVWIDDVSVDTSDSEAVAQWRHGITHLLRVWAHDGGARSLHICNTGPGWTALVTNPSLFNEIQIYLYVFNDDLIFPNTEMNMEQVGYHSPIYNCADVLDRPNIHIITDSEHHKQRLGELIGLSDRIRKISIPVKNMPTKKKSDPSDTTDVLWAGRIDHFKGVESLLKLAREYGQKYQITVYGDGETKLVEQLIAAHKEGILKYYGRYDDFAKIPGKYDFFLFTSEREGMPNVVKEALVSGLPVLAKNAAWKNEIPCVTIYNELRDIEFYRLEERRILVDNIFSREYCELLAISAYKECLS